MAASKQEVANVKRGLSLHARRLSSPRLRASIEPQKIRGLTKHVLPIRRGPSSNLFFYLQKLYSIVIGFFVCSPYLQESLLEPVGSVTTHAHTYVLRVYICLVRLTGASQKESRCN